MIFTNVKKKYSQAKKENSKLTRVSLTISEKGLKMMDIVSKEILMDISINKYKQCIETSFNSTVSVYHTAQLTQPLTMYLRSSAGTVRPMTWLVTHSSAPRERW